VQSFFLTRSGVLATAAGLLLAVAVWAGMSALLPPVYARTLLPAAAGLSCGVLLWLWMAARDGWFPLAGVRWTAFAFGLGAALVATVLLVEPRALDPRRFGYWMPLLAGPAVAVWAAAFLVERRLQRSLPLFTALLGALCLAAVLVHNAGLFYGALRGEHLRTWNVYHYYLGSKYFSELGYWDLYAATLAADDKRQQEKSQLPASERDRADAVPDFGHIDRTRDMHTYRVVPRHEISRRYDRSAFSNERWKRFAEDTRWLRPRYHTEGWCSVLTDWGLNPTPVWMAAGGLLSNRIALQSPLFLLITNSDLPLFILMFAALWWAFGLRPALAAVTWVNLIHFNRGRLAGGFMQYDWLASMVVALALYHRRRPALAGAALSWAMMTRVFPGFLVLPLLLKAPLDLLRGRGGAGQGARLQRLRFLVGLGAACLLLFLASQLNARGWYAWPEWIEKITMHREALDLDPMQLGIGRLAQHAPSTDDFWAARVSSPYRQSKGASRAAFGFRLLGGLLLLGALWRRRDQDAMILMLFAVFLGLTLTRYYGTAWVLLFMLGAGGRSPRISWPAALAGTWLLCMAAWFYAPGWHAARYFWANYQFFALGCLVCALYTWSSLFPRGRLFGHGEGQQEGQGVEADTG
jgi:hypothetical protein